MPTFIYKAKQGPDKTFEGNLNAESHTAALAALDAMGYSPVWVREKPGDAAQRSRLSRRRIIARDITVFARQMAGLIKAGVPILKALSTMGEQSESARFRRVVQDLTSGVRDGNPLSTALAKYPKLFSDLFVSMIRAGESAGALDRVLFRLAEAREQEEEARRKVQAAIAYPLLIIGVGLVTVFVLLAFFMPQVVGLFRNYQDLPVPTRLLIGITDFFSRSWHWILIVALLVMAIFRRLASMSRGRIFVDTLKLHTPVLAEFLVRSDVARFARTLSLLVDSGISIDKALFLSVNTLGNTVLREEIEGIRQRVIRQGMTLSAGLKGSRYFPALAANLIAVGEESGRLEESLLEVAGFYERELDHRSRMFTALLEPILILVVGGVVGFIVAAMLLPVFKLGTSL